MQVFRPILAVALVAMFVALTPLPSSAQSSRKLVVGDSTASALSWPVLIAKDKNFFGDEKLDVELEYAGGTTQAIQQLIGGSTDLTSTSFESAILAMDKGAQITIFGGSVLVFPFTVMSAKDVHSAADMKGKRIILAYPQNTITVLWNRWLQQNGLAVSDVDQVYDGSSANRYRALQIGTVQAAGITQPFDLVAEDAGFNRLLDLSTVAPHLAQQGFAARKDWLSKNGEAATSFLRAVFRGVAFFYDPAHRRESEDILVRNAKIEPSVAAKTYAFYADTFRPFSKDGTITDDSVKTLLDILIQINELKDTSETTAKYIDTSFLPQSK